MSDLTPQNPPELSLSPKVYLKLPVRLQRLLLLRSILARAALIGLLAAALNLRPALAYLGRFELYNPFVIINSPKPHLASADLNNDGDLDILVGDGKGGLNYFENTGSASSPALATPLFNPFGLKNVGRDSAPALADLDHDGDVDILIGIRNGNLHYFKNTGSPSNPAFAKPIVNPFGLKDVGGYVAPALADLDHDGDLDLLVGDYDGNLHYFKNNGSPTNPAFAVPMV